MNTLCASQRKKNAELFTNDLMHVFDDTFASNTFGNNYFIFFSVYFACVCVSAWVRRSVVCHVPGQLILPLSTLETQNII